MEREKLPPETVLADKYRLESVLGVGGMGTVYRAEHLALKAPVAVKVMDRDVSDDDITLTRFLREAQAAAALRSPHVVQILDYGRDGDRAFMVMEMLEGEPLSDRIERYGRLTAEETFRVISHVAKAVAKAHEADIIHRDLKPDNVFLVHNEGDEIAKVLDFGVAKIEATALDGQGHTRTGSLLGTPYYMSPEQAQGNKDIDARSDLWALGVIAFECMTGKRPFSSDGLGDLVLQICIREIPLPSTYAEVPPGFDDWFRHACMREPADRFQTARELTESLRTALQIGGEGAPGPESLWSAAARPVGTDSRLSAIETRSSAATQVADAPEKQERRSQRLTLNVAAEATQEQEDEFPDGEAQDAEGEGAEERATRPSPVSATAVDVRASNWQVVPHGETNENHTVADDYSPIPRSRGAWSVFFVAIVALLVGGGGVLLVRQSGLLERNDTRRITPVRPVSARPSVDAAGMVTGKNAHLAAGSTTVSSPSKKGEGKPLDPSTEGEDAETPTTEDAELTATEDEGDKLDRIDSEASATEPSADAKEADAKKAADAKNAANPEGEESTEPSKERPREKTAGEQKPQDGSPGQPSPTLPETLAPSPAPPPPTVEK